MIIFTFPEILVFQIPFHSRVGHVLHTTVTDYTCMRVRIAVVEGKGVNNLESDELLCAATTKLRNMQ